jgi:hypothetical protein
MPHAPPEKRNPRRVDRHQHQARVKLRRSNNEEALETFSNIKISKIVNTTLDGAPETAMFAALCEAMRRKARAS